MVAVSQFVEFSVTSQTFLTGTNTDSPQTVAQGSRGYSRGTGFGPTGNDRFTIVSNSNDQLAVQINGVGPFTITLASGTGLDPRFVARDITYKLNNASADDSFKFAQCQWRNGGIVGPNTTNSFIINSGRLGSNSGNNAVHVTSPGVRDARTTLGFNTVSEASGQSFAQLFSSSSYTGVLTASGSFGGQFDDFYTIQISEGETVSGTSGGGGNVYNGTSKSGGLYVGASNTTYTITISTANGNVMGAGTGFVPTFTVVSSPVADSNANPIELLYKNHWYDVSSLGVRISFSDAVFGNGDTFTINAFTAFGSGYPKAVGSARYIWSSASAEDSSKAFGISPVTTQTTGTQVGTRGATVAFSNSGTLHLGERFQITCRGPRAINNPVTQLNFGNVTVSTNSPVKVVWFELISGAISMSVVKFSLQNDGSFQNHNKGNNDTLFHYGTEGAGNHAPGGGPTSNSQVEFFVDVNGLGKIVATDISSNTPPSYLFATQGNLSVVNSADSSQSVGNWLGGLVSDFVFVAIQLGATETGANSTINYRMYFNFA